MKTTLLLEIDISVSSFKPVLIDHLRCILHVYYDHNVALNDVPYIRVPAVLSCGKVSHAGIIIAEFLAQYTPQYQCDPHYGMYQW